MYLSLLRALYKEYLRSQHLQALLRLLPVYRHFKHDYEEEIKQYIQNSRQRKRNKRHFGFAYTSENRRLKVVQQYDRHSEKIYSQVQQSKLKHIIWHIKRRKKWLGYYFADYRNQYTADYRHYHRSVHGFLHRLFVISSYGICYYNICAERYADK